MLAAAACRGYRLHIAVQSGAKGTNVLAAVDNKSRQELHANIFSRTSLSALRVIGFTRLSNRGRSALRNAVITEL